MSETIATAGTGQADEAAHGRIARMWVPYTKAAREYVGLDKSVLLGAMKRHELKGYEKPITRERRHDAREYHSYYVNLGDVDEWIRTHWKPAFAS